MEQMARLILWFVFAGLALTAVSSLMAWYYENTRRLNRTLKRTLGKPADAVVYDLSGARAAGLDFTNGDCCILWRSGAEGLVFSFDEIEGAELIVDERVVARTQKGETRRVLEETHSQATRVTLRLMFADAHTPEFELSLFGDVTQNPLHPKSATEAVRLGRKWLSHIDAVIRRQTAPSQTLPAQTPVAQKPAEAPKPQPLTAAASPDHVTNDTLARDLPY